MGLALARHFTHDHRVLNRATWSARHGSRILLGVLITLLVPSGATMVLAAFDQETRDALFRSEMGEPDALGPGTLESPGLIDRVRQMRPQVRRWLPKRRVVVVVDGGFAAVSLALACVK